MTNELITRGEHSLIRTYESQPIVLDHGQSCYMYDTDGKKYVDYAAGIAVASLGHANPVVLKAINDQAKKVITCQASYATEPKIKCAEYMIANSCFDLVYFSNSGTESMEAALKTARKWAYEEKSKEANEFICFHNSFHGRTYGSVSITEKSLHQPFFGPYIPGVHFADFNDLESVKKRISKKTAAIIVEPVQGEGGLYPATSEFLQGLRDLCDKEQIALIFDEIQAGMGRLGTFTAYESFGVEPDIGTYAKGMGSGFPVGAMMAKRAFGKHIIPGDHGTTYGGNPLACAVALAVMQEINTPAFLNNVKETGKILVDGLNELKRESNKIEDVRGMGLMVGVDAHVEIKDLIRGAQKNGLLTTQAGKRTLRLTPPLVAGRQQAEEAVEILAKTLKEL